MIGYMCAWLRYYYPYEFITSFLNNSETESDISNGSELANIYGIQINPPRFGYSSSKYMYDKNSHTISKGIGSVKFLNNKVADKLFEYYHTQQINDVGQLMCDLSKIANSRQLEILIRIDYFAAYGNINELLRIVQEMDAIKFGTAKKISKDKVKGSIFEHIELSKYCNDKNKNGTEAKSWTIEDMDGLKKVITQYIFNLALPDCTFKEKIDAQKEYLGYIDLTTGKEEDVRKLIITDLFPLKSKITGHIWCYVVVTKSLGTGKVSSLNVSADIYEQKPINKADIIFAESVYKNHRGYWYLDKYHIIQEI